MKTGFLISYRQVGQQAGVQTHTLALPPPAHHTPLTPQPPRLTAAAADAPPSCV
jgi:hypothetical protein